MAFTVIQQMKEPILEAWIGYVAIFICEYLALILQNISFTRAKEINKDLFDSSIYTDIYVYKKCNFP